MRQFYGRTKLLIFGSFDDSCGFNFVSGVRVIELLRKNAVMKLAERSMSREKPRALLLLKGLMAGFMTVTLISGHVHTQQFPHLQESRNCIAQTSTKFSRP